MPSKGITFGVSKMANLGAQNNGQGLLKNFSLKKLQAWSM